MNPRKFFKNLGLLSVLASVLVFTSYGVLVYADKYTWNSVFDVPNSGWQVVQLSDSYGYAGRAGGDLYTTLNYGSSWTLVYSFGPTYTFQSIATSHNGVYVLISLANNAGGNDVLAVSSNYGASFTYTQPNVSSWIGAAVSEDGQFMYTLDVPQYSLVYSTNYGASWSSTALPSSENPTAVAINSDGQTVYVTTNSAMYRSTDYGSTFSPVGNLLSYTDIDISSSGQYVVAIALNGNIQLSSDYGNTFSQVIINNITSWRSVSISDDGSKIAVLDNANRLYTSIDSGATFGIESTVSNFTVAREVSLSSVGDNAVLASSDTYLWSSQIDRVAPQILSVASNSANGAYNAGDTIELRVNFSEPVYNTDIELVLETGATDRSCYISATDGDTITTCNYVVQPGDTSSDLSTSNIIGTIYDEAGNAKLSHTGHLIYLSQNYDIVVDTTAPEVSVTSPADGSTASSTTSLSASASDDSSGVVGVQFKVGATNIGTEDTSSPYTASWDTTAISDGVHTLYAVARDVAGNYATSSISITVLNAVAPSTPDPTPTVTSSGPTSYGFQTVQTGQTVEPISTIFSVQNNISKIPKNSISSAFRFTQNAGLRKVSEEVFNLQKMLNLLGFVVSSSGVGSTGKETSYFGPKTKLALIRFQRAFEVPTTGFFGPRSRAIMNNILKGFD